MDGLDTLYLAYDYHRRPAPRGGITMNHRERVLTTLNHREPDRVPRWAWIDSPVVEELRRRTGETTPAEYWNFDLRSVGFLPPDPLPDLKAMFGRYHGEKNYDWVLDWEHRDYSPEWGVATRPAHFYHLSAPVPPMVDFTSVAELEAYPFPDYMNDWRHDHLETDVQRLRDAGYAVNASLGWVFQTAWTLRTREKLFVDFYENPEFADFLLSRITEIRKAQAIRFAEAGVDSISMNDDIGMQTSMMISPRMWRRWLRPRVAGLIKAIHHVNPDIYFRYHTDGYFTPVIPDLIEVGVSSLITVQPECMDVFEIKRRFGDLVTLEGTIGLQSELLSGNPDEVRRMVKRQFENLMPGGGFIASTANGVGPDVPWENLEALFEAIDEYGNY